ncbi:hypothetical protein LF1_54850 [Rubripirellula obstinata]|uniref:Uncharacterized protein n=1 Tax=Rubripirellula obstinata TaxID=406547 RepID=A0A5B1CBZ7_9BACT|nr:HAD domain-containing protein [Rubripirellula obstinata]KAA1257179.1 hypothetical protein LF1_55790 [Rubripirellula obstinata]KAA1257336.1 hypothetical protein LF1_54850 [Rubripirellula obstinata]
MIVFLDFDGVLRRDSSPPSCFQADCTHHFESAIRPFTSVSIVISSSWRVAVSLSEIRSFFSDDIAKRIIGKTPELELERHHTRYKEILRYLDDRTVPADAWLAIDDSADLFPRDAPLLLTQPDTGFDSACAVKLRQLLLSTRDDG